MQMGGWQSRSLIDDTLSMLMMINRQLSHFSIFKTDIELNSTQLRINTKCKAILPFEATHEVMITKIVCQFLWVPSFLTVLCHIEK